MGKIFYDMGFLANAEVVECSATDLVGQYVGQTGPKTQNLLEKALGKVLFIDEAYRLAEGHFAQEAMDELVDCLTKPKFAQKLITILAGYDEDINRLMSINPGLSSRFPETVCFKHLSPEQCFDLFQNCLQKGHKLDSTAVQAPSTAFKETLLKLFESLAQLPAWGNARDVKTLAKSVTNKVLASTTADTRFEITEDIVLLTARLMISEREHRKKSTASSRRPSLPMQLLPHDDALIPPPPALNTVTKTATSQDVPLPTPPPPPLQDLEPQTPCRDPDVSDETWAQLQSDQRAANEREQQHRSLLAQEAELQDQLQVAQAAAAAAVEARKRAELEEEEGNAEARQRLEQERLSREREWRAQMEIAVAMERERRAREAERRKEQAVQMKLREMGVCVMGFRWIKQAKGYRCSGGTHFVSDAQLGI